MADNLILAHDLGTSGDKACLFDTGGNFLAEAYYTYKTYYPREGYAEHDPRDWWEAVKNASKEVVKNAKADPADVKAISFSAHGMGAIPVDKEGNLLVDKVMVWMDARSTDESKLIAEKVGERRHYEMTGNSFDLALYPSAKLLWLKRHRPEVYNKTYKFISTKEYLIHKMTGNIRYTDYGEAGMSGLYNLNTHQWDPELLKVSEVDEEKLLEVVDGTTVVGELTGTAATEMGLKKGTTVVQGSWDNLGCAIGGGVKKEGTMVVCLGTAGWMGILHDKPIMAPGIMSNVVYAGNDKYFTTAHSHSACAAYDWMLAQMCPDIMKEKNAFAKIEAMAREIPAGSDKLFFMPSMFSGNTFYSDAGLCATYVGMKMIHNRGHLIRSAMEGVGFDLMMGAQFFEQVGAMPQNANLIGGGANNDLWMQILTDMFNVEISRPKNLQHIGALGAAFLAGVGTGFIKDFDMVSEIIRSEDMMSPNQEVNTVYKKLLPVYKKSYEQLIPVYQDMQSVKY